MKKFFPLIIYLLIFLLPACGVVENKKINLQEAVRTTLEANPNVKIERLNTELAKNNIKSANRLQNPSIGTVQNMGPAGKSNPQQAGVEYTIELLKRGKRKKAAETFAQTALNNQKFLEYNLIAEVKKAYIDLLLKKANLKIINEQCNLSKELYEKTKSDFENGKLPKTELIQAQIAYNHSLMYLNRAKSEVITSQNRFNLTLNTEEINYDTEEDDLTDDFEALDTLNPAKPLPDFNLIKNYALTNRQDLIKAKREVEIAKQNLKITKSLLIPDLEISGGYAYQTKGFSEDGVSVSGAYAGINLVNIPLFYGYKPEINNSQIEIQKALLNLENVKIDVIRDITDAWEKYTIARNNLAFYDKELLKNLKELSKEAQKTPETKEIDVTDILVSKKLYLELILGYKTALSDYYISYAELLKEMNAEAGDIEAL